MGSGTDSTLTTAPSSYLSYLPGIYGDADGSGGLPFLALYLKVFEKLLSGIADGLDLVTADSNLDASIAYRAGIRQLLDATVIGNLFYPRWNFLFPGSDSSVFMPPLSEDQDPDDQQALFNTLADYFGLPQFGGETDGLSPVEVWTRSFLAWLGGTIGWSIDKNWTIDAMRTMIAQAFPFDRARGTPMGMTWLLNACLAARPAPMSNVTLKSVGVNDCVRPTLIVFDADTAQTPAYRVCDSYPDPSKAVIISDVVGPEIDRDSNGLPSSPDDTTLVANVPWHFEIDITLTAAQGTSASDQQFAMAAYLRLVRSVLDTAKPALTTYAVNFMVQMLTPSSSSSSAPRDWVRERSDVWSLSEDGL